MWTHRIWRPHRDLAARTVTELTAGRPQSFVRLPSGHQLAAGMNLGEIGGAVYATRGEAAPGTGGPADRLAEQDRDGLAAELLFPSPMLGALAADVRSVAGGEAVEAVIRGYNDFLIKDYCSAAPDRLIPVPVLPPTSMSAALAELERLVCSDKVRTVCLVGHPNGSEHGGSEDLPFWRVVEQSGLTLAIHKAIARLRIPPSAEVGDLRRTLVRSVERPTAATFVELFLAGVFEAAPGLRLYFAESEVSWLPSAIASLDDAVSRYRRTVEWPYYRTPIDCLESCYFGIVRDRLLTDVASVVPFDHLLWGSDFPHSITTFPDSRDFVATAYGRFGDAAVRLLTGGTASTLGFF